MTTQLLPDRERRHLLQFYVWPRLEYRTRLAMAGSLVLAGLALQMLWPWNDTMLMLWITVPLLLAGNLLLLVRGYNLKPQSQESTGRWEKTTRDRLRQVQSLEQKVGS